MRIVHQSRVSTSDSQRKQGRNTRESPGGLGPSSGGRDPHFEQQGYTAEDDEGIGYGEEGFLAEEYPGHNALRGESERERRHRAAVTWSWPRTDVEVRGGEGSGLRSDLRICREIGRRMLRAEARPKLLVASVLEGEVTLEGEVESLEEKQMIEGMAESIEGVRRLDSRLAVEKGPRSTKHRTHTP